MDLLGDALAVKSLEKKNRFVKCRIKKCTELVVFDTKSKVPAMPSYGCALCEKKAECKTGYFRCPKHSFNMCNGCFEACKL